MGAPGGGDLSSGHTATHNAQSDMYLGSYLGDDSFVVQLWHATYRHSCRLAAWRKSPFVSWNMT
jgi:hypothetical protein